VRRCGRERRRRRESGASHHPLWSVGGGCSACTG